jgi:GMP reductase
MSSVVNDDICKWLSFNNYPYIYHRFADTRKFLQRARAESWPFVSICVGVNDVDKTMVMDIAASKCRVDWITIDIAAGFSVMLEDMVKHIRKYLPDAKIIAGNFGGGGDVVEFCNKLDVDAVKFGIGGGKACTTYNCTGFISPMPDTAIFASSSLNKPLILDGGVRSHGDISIAMVMGYQRELDNVPLIMAGSLFAACLDAPSDTVKRGDKTYKVYYGSASEKQKGNSQNVEGRVIELEANGLTYAEEYDKLKQDIQSAISYSGGRNIKCFNNVNYYKFN